MREDPGGDLQRKGLGGGLGGGRMEEGGEEVFEGSL